MNPGQIPTIPTVLTISHDGIRAGGLLGLFLRKKRNRSGHAFDTPQGPIYTGLFVGKRAEVSMSHGVGYPLQAIRGSLPSPVHIWITARKAFDAVRPAS